MKIGDLVSLKMKKTQPPQVPRHGLVLNMWRNHKGMLLEIDVMWTESSRSVVGAVDAPIRRLRADLFEVVDECR